MSNMKILTLDIETAPMKVYAFGLWDQNIGINQIIEKPRILCFSAKWTHEKNIFFNSEHHSSRTQMLSDLHAFLEEADVVVHFNGRKFDIPWINSELALEGFEPPASYKEVDLYKAAKAKFYLPSYKLDYIAQWLGVGSKTTHTGFQLWIDCLNGDEKAWALMKKYNMQDVKITEDVYIKILGWIPNHPNHNLFNDSEGCKNCGSPHIVNWSTVSKLLGKYSGYTCKDCGFKGDRGKAIKTTDIR